MAKWGNMKKLALILGVLSLVACTDQKVVNYNTARLDNIEAYLANNKAVKPSENVDKLVEEGKVEYSEEYLSLEKEADKWRSSRRDSCRRWSSSTRRSSSKESKKRYD